MRLKAIIPSALLCSACVGCAASRDAVARVGACAAAISKGAEPIGQNGECDLGRRTYLVAWRRGMGCSMRAASDQRTLPNQAFDCVDHKHGPNRKLDQIPVENPVSITGGSGSYPDR